MNPRIWPNIQQVQIGEDVAAYVPFFRKKAKNEPFWTCRA